MGMNHSQGETESSGQWMEKDMHRFHPVSRHLLRNEGQNTHAIAFKHKQQG